MSEEKRFGTAGSDGGKSAKDFDDKLKTSGGSRARNRTVMLTPEMTGQVRAMLYQEPEDDRPDPVNEIIAPVDWSRPESTGDVTVQDSDSSRGADFGRDFSTPQVSEARGGSTGKIDLDLIAEASEPLASAETGRRVGAPGGFSVNPHAGARPVMGGASAPGIRRTAAPVSAAAPHAARIAAPAPTSKIVGFLISFDKETNGEVHEIRAGRWLVTSRATDHGEYILINDETISPLHAIVRATKEGKVQILDQLSEFGTGVLRVGSSAEEEVAGAMVGVDHGDILRLGQRKFVVCLVPKTELAAATSE